MALNDNAVITPAVGHVYLNTPGSARPSKATIAAFDPATFGAQKYVIVDGGGPLTSYTLTVEGDTTASLDDAADADDVQAALEDLDSVGVGNVLVTGVSLVDAAGLTIWFVGELHGEALTLTGTGTGGTSPVVTPTVTAPNGWVDIGHTSRDDMPEFGFEGGEFETRGTWQNATLREVQTEALADFLTLFLHQFDIPTLELYFGENQSVEDGVFEPADSPTPIEKAFLVVITDGDANVALHCPKASIRRDDAIQLPVDNFASFPVRATFLKHLSSRKYAWVSELFSTS